MKTILSGLLVILSAAGVPAQGYIIFHNGVLGTIVTHVYAPLSSNPAMHQIGNGTADGHYSLGGYITGTTDWTGFTLIGANGVGGPFGAASTFAQLLGARGYDQPEASLLPAFPVTTFRTGDRAGQVVPVESAINMPPGAPFATVEMVAWDNSSGLYPTWTEASAAWRAGLIAAGESGPWNQDNFGPAPAPNLVSGDGSQYVQSFNLYFIPEPSVLALAGLGAVLLAVGRWRLKPLKSKPLRNASKR